MLLVFFFVPHPQHIFTSLFLKVAASEIHSKNKYVGKQYKGGVKFGIAMLFPSAPSKWNKREKPILLSARHTVNKTPSLCFPV